MSFDSNFSQSITRPLIWLCFHMKNLPVRFTKYLFRTTYDAIAVGTALTNGGALSLNFGTTFLTPGTTSFDLFSFASQSGNFTSVAIAGGYSLNSANSSGTWKGNSKSNTFSFAQSTGDLTVTAVPEPSTWVGAGLIVGLVGISQRKRLRDLVS